MGSDVGRKIAGVMRIEGVMGMMECQVERCLWPVCWP